MYAPFAIEAERAGNFTALSQSFLVSIIRDRTVEGADTSGAGGGHDALHGVVKSVAGIRRVPLVHRADAPQGHVEARRKIAWSKMQRGKPSRSPGDVISVYEPFGILYLRFDFHFSWYQATRHL